MYDVWIVVFKTNSHSMEYITNTDQAYGIIIYCLSNSMMLWKFRKVVCKMWKE